MFTCIPVLSGTSETFAVFFYRSRHGLVDAIVYGNITSCSPAHIINLDIVSVDRKSYPCKAFLMTSTGTCRYICDCPTGEHCSHLTAIVNPSGVQGQDHVTIYEIKTFWGLARNHNKTRAQFMGFNIQWNLSITTILWDTSLPSGAHLGGQAQKLLTRVNWYLQSPLKHITE